MSEHVMYLTNKPNRKQYRFDVNFALLKASWVKQTEVTVTSKKQQPFDGPWQWIRPPQYTSPSTLVQIKKNIYFLGCFRIVDLNCCCLNENMSYVKENGNYEDLFTDETPELTFPPNSYNNKSNQNSLTVTWKQFNSTPWQKLIQCSPQHFHNNLFYQWSYIA